MQLVAGLLPRNLDRGLDALGRFEERDLEVVAEIGAALGAAAAASAEQIAEAKHVAEDVGEVAAEVREHRRIEACPGARTPS